MHTARSFWWQRKWTSLRKKLDSLSLSPQKWIKFYSNRQAHFNVQASKEKKRVRHAFPCFYISDILSFFLLQGTGGSFKVTLALLVQHWIAAMDPCLREEFFFQIMIIQNSFFQMLVFSYSLCSEKRLGQIKGISLFFVSGEPSKKSGGWVRVKRLKLFCANQIK